MTNENHSSMANRPPSFFTRSSLMSIDLRKLDEVWTSDDVRLGLAQRLLHRTEAVNPALQLYATYLRVRNFDFGDEYYVPVDFVAGRAPATGHIRLSVPFATVQTQTWTRMPQFVLAGLAESEELPENESATV
jgi:hypothetical protein